MPRKGLRVRNIWDVYLTLFWRTALSESEKSILLSLCCYIYISSFWVWVYEDSWAKHQDLKCCIKELQQDTRQMCSHTFCEWDRGRKKNWVRFCLFMPRWLSGEETRLQDNISIQPLDFIGGLYFKYFSIYWYVPL